MEDEETTGNLRHEGDHIRKSLDTAHFRHLYHELEQRILGYMETDATSPPAE